MSLNQTQRLEIINKTGQSFWIDDLSRAFLHSSTGLAHFIKTKGIVGLTSNPSIFEKAIAKSKDYDADIQTLLKGEIGHGKKRSEIAEDIYQKLAVRDVQQACDIL